MPFCFGLGIPKPKMLDGMSQEFPTQYLRHGRAGLVFRRRPSGLASETKPQTAATRRPNRLILSARFMPKSVLRVESPFGSKKKPTTSASGKTTQLIAESGDLELWSRAPGLAHSRLIDGRNAILSVEPPHICRLIFGLMNGQSKVVVELAERSVPGTYGPRGATAQAYGIHNAAPAIGNLLGPIFAGGLKAVFGWASMGWVFGILRLVTGMLVLTFLEEWIGRMPWTFSWIRRRGRAGRPLADP